MQTGVRLVKDINRNPELPERVLLCFLLLLRQMSSKAKSERPHNPMTQSHILPTMVPALVLLLFLSSGTTAAGDGNIPSPAVYRTVCGKNQTTNPEAFDVNFVNAMEKIFQNISNGGFAISSSGDNFTAYGLGQCFSYLSPINCQLCYSQSRVKLPLCLPATTGRIFLDGCFLEYSDRNVSSNSVEDGDTFACSNFTVGGSVQETFRNLTTDLVGNLTAAAYLMKDYYAVGSVPVSPGLTVYGMAQCWRSLNASGCRECLEQGKQSIISKCLPADDAKAMNAGCFLRYSTKPFYLTASAGGGGGRGSSSTGHRVTIAVSTVLAAIVVIGLVFLWRMRRSSSICGQDAENEGVNREIIRSITKSHLSFKYEDLSKATCDFSQNNKLGQGGFGAVYKGILPDGREIAVKRLFFNTRQWVDQFFNEVTLINQVQHKNLVKLLGCSVEGPESLLVYEYLRNSSLDNYLFDSFKKTELSWERRLDIIVGTAEGLAYLHNASVVRIIHRDIKASNILLDNRFKPKISDFGLARYFAEDQSHLSTGLAGTFGYMAPEYIVHGQLTEKADIYGYGVLVLEIITGRKNQNSISTSVEGHSLMQQIWQQYNSDSLMALLDPDLEGRCSEEEALKVFKVGLLCVQASPTLRPPMWKVVEMLNSRSNQLPNPTQPPFLSLHKGAISGSSESSDLLSSSLSSRLGGQASVNEISVSIFQGR